jgi:hypothetical protein
MATGVGSPTIHSASEQSVADREEDNAEGLNGILISLRAPDHIQRDVKIGRANST